MKKINEEMELFKFWSYSTLWKPKLEIVRQTTQVAANENPQHNKKHEMYYIPKRNIRAGNLCKKNNPQMAREITQADIEGR